MPSYTTAPDVFDIDPLGCFQGLSYLYLEPDFTTEESVPKILRRKCHSFFSIPYALPPTGERRFCKPQPLPSNYCYGTPTKPGIFDGSGGIKMCPQPGVDGKLRPETWDEDCLKLNLWIPSEDPRFDPAGYRPDDGWPVLFFIHGGFLQFGHPYAINPVSLISQTHCKCIIVAPAYRLNVFGFLASPDLSSTCASPNLGFHDQRAALEWTWSNIHHFGGDPQNLTLSGYSAGAHSAFHQLAHHIDPPGGRSLSDLRSDRRIRRVMMLSNGPGMQPKSLDSLQTREQFDLLLRELNIPLGLSPEKKLARLRECDAETLVNAAGKIELHEFRAVSDDEFISSELFDRIDNYWASLLQASSIKILMGECRDEHFMYSAWRPPKDNTYAALRTRLCADYPPNVVDQLLEQIYCPDKQLPHGYQGWTELFGVIYADLQVHALERGFVATLEAYDHPLHPNPDSMAFEPGFCTVNRVSRYRVEFRSQCMRREYSGIPEEWGVTHTTDMPIWFWGNGMGQGLTGLEKGMLIRPFVRPYWEFICGRLAEKERRVPNPHLKPDSEEAVGFIRVLRPNCEVALVKDDDSEKSKKIWDLIREAQSRDQKEELKRREERRGETERSVKPKL